MANRTAVLEDVQILPNTWRNFTGERRQYNAEGSRYFNISLNKDQYEAMLRDEWPVRVREASDEFSEPLYFMQCKVRYRRDPDTGQESSHGVKVVVITSRGQTSYDNTMIKELDNADIRMADVMVRQSPWQDERDGGKTKYSAYCNELYVTIEESYLERKYGTCVGDECEISMPQDEASPKGTDENPPWED